MTTAVSTKTENGPSPRSWVTLGALTVTFVGVANKVRKAKGATDPIIHIDVILGLATLFVAIVKVRRDRRGPAA